MVTQRTRVVKQCSVVVVDFAIGEKLIKELQQTERPLGANCRENGTDLVSTSQQYTG